MYRLLLLATAVFASHAASAAPTVQVTYEAPGVVNSTAGFTFKGVENFDSRSGAASFTSDFGTTGQGTVITGTYSEGVPGRGVQINNFDQYGGALQTTGDKYPVAFNRNPYTLTITSVVGNNAGNGINFFGYWLSALDAGNELRLYEPNAVTPFFSFLPAQVLSAVSGNPAYHGMPIGTSNKGSNGGEPYVFVNFFVKDGVIGKVEFSENANFGGGYESDNHTVGFYTTESGLPVLPEPASLAVLGAGLISLAGMARRRRA